MYCRAYPTVKIIVATKFVHKFSLDFAKPITKLPDSEFQRSMLLKFNTRICKILQYIIVNQKLRLQY